MYHSLSRGHNRALITQLRGLEF